MLGGRQYQKGVNGLNVSMLWQLKGERKFTGRRSLFVWVDNRKVSRRPESGGVALCFIQGVTRDELNRFDFLDDQLGDTVTGLDMNFIIGMIEEEDFDFTSVMRVDHSGTAIQAKFNRQPTAWPDQTDITVWKLNLNTSCYQFTASRSQSPSFG
jgi:hypothetical protein